MERRKQNRITQFDKTTRELTTGTAGQSVLVSNPTKASHQLVLAGWRFVARPTVCVPSMRDNYWHYHLPPLLVLAVVSYHDCHDHHLRNHGNGIDKVH